MARDLEDRIDDAVAAALRFCAANAWSFADRMFKALGWLVALGVLRAVYQRTHSSEVMILGIALGLVWLAAMAGEIYKIHCWTADSSGRALRMRTSGAWAVLLRIVFAMVVTAVVGTVTFEIILPIVGKAALDIFVAVGQR